MSFFEEEETPGMCVCRGKVVWKPSRKAAVYKPRREASPWSEKSSLCLELWENKVALLSHPVRLWYSVMTTPVGSYVGVGMLRQGWKARFDWSVKDGTVDRRRAAAGKVAACGHRPTFPVLDKDRSFHLVWITLLGRFLQHLNCTLIQGFSASALSTLGASNSLSWGLSWALWTISISSGLFIT